MILKEVSFTCECGEKLDARSSPLRDVFCNPMLATLCFLLSLGMMLLLDWLLMEMLYQYNLQDIHTALANGKYYTLYSIMLMLISGWFTYHVIAIEQQHQNHRNGVSVLYGHCKKCKRRRRFVQHTQVAPQSWFQFRCYDDERFEEE